MQKATQLALRLYREKRGMELVRRSLLPSAAMLSTDRTSIFAIPRHIGAERTPGRMRPITAGLA